MARDDGDDHGKYTGINHNEGNLNKQPRQQETKTTGRNATLQADHDHDDE
jgi:hypothetical protein